MNIKKILLITSVLCLGFFTVQAQNSDDRFSLGPRLGINFSNVSNVDNAESATGIVLGLTSTYSISERSGLTVDLLYSEEGYELNGTQVDLRYLQVPILFNFFFGELGERFRPKVYVGLTPGFFLNGKVEDVDLEKDDFSSFVVAATGGLGFNYRVGSRIWLNTDLRSYLGLSDLRDEAIGDAVKTTNIQFSVGLAYGLARYN